MPDTDEQTFEIAVTPRFRARYNEILAPILAEVCFYRPSPDGNSNSYC